MPRPSRWWTSAVCGLVLVLMPVGARPSCAQDAAPGSSPRAFAALFDTPPLLIAPVGEPVLVAAVRGDPARLFADHLVAVPPLPGRPIDTRRSWLPPLYASFAVLQALDAHSTLRAIDAGHRERNPFVAPFADRAGVMVAAKAATTVGTIYLAHRLGQRNRAAAIALMVAVNAAYGAIVAANYGRP